jgi:nucleoside-diphosphate-sugar epimerase
MRCLVTGATGFVGSHLSQALLRSGWQVTALVRTETVSKPGFRMPAGVDIAACDGSASSILAAVMKARSSIVFHLASMIYAQHSLEELQSLINSNLLFGTQLLEAMAVSGCKYFINTGSYLQHYQGVAYNPSTLYAATKQAFEAIMEYYKEGCGLSAVTLRLFDTYGPRDNRPKILNYLAQQLTSNQPLPMSPGGQMMDLLHVDDVCSAYLHTARLLMGQNTLIDSNYSVASGQLRSLRSIVELFEHLAGRSLAIEWGGLPYRPREVMVPWIAARLPGWQSKITLEVGLKQLIDEHLKSLVRDNQIGT